MPAELISLDEYMRTSYLPDRDYQAMGVECIFEEDHPPQEVHDGRLVAQRLAIEVALADILPADQQKQS